MKKIFRISLIAIVPIIVLAGFLSVAGLVGKAHAGPVFQKGMCYTTWNKKAYASERSDASLEKLKSINVEWVTILTTWYQDHCFATDIFSTKKTPTDESLKHAIVKARSLGMKVILKPHLDIISTEFGNWRGDIACVSEPDWEKWFENYEKFIIHYAKMAEKTGAEMFCVGTELVGATTHHVDQWKKVIKEVRKVFKGDLVYAANWNDEYLQIRFWDDLDYAGIDAYFPLSDKDNPTYEELVEAWQKWVPEIEAWQKRINKPVIFPEIGYCSATQAARSPWERAPEAKADMQLQVDCYKAMVDTFWDKEWFYGIYWWDWGTSVKMGGKSNRNFTPQNKLVEEYIKEIYKRKVNR